MQNEIRGVEHNNLYCSYSIQQILAKYEHIEGEIRTKSFYRGLEALKNFPEISVRGNVILLNEQPYRIDHIQPESTLLRLSVSPLSVSLSPKWTTMTKSLEEIGLIRRLEVLAPKRIIHQIEPMLDLMVKEFRSHYADLEYAFRTDYLKHEHVLADGLTDLLSESFPEKEGKKANSCFLTITVLEFGKYAWHFSYNTVVRILDTLKRNPLPGISPLRTILTLITGEAEDSWISLGKIDKKKFKPLEYSSLRSKSDSPELWYAQKSILLAKELAVREICEVANYSLQANIPSRFCDIADQAVNSAQKRMTDQFKKNLDNYAAYRRMIRNLSSDNQKKTRAKDEKAQLAKWCYGLPEMFNDHSKKPTVFVSHSSEDIVFTQQLVAILRSHDIDVWVDVEKIWFGDPVADNIYQGLTDSDFLLVVVSSNFVKSSWCRPEIRHHITKEIEEHRTYVIAIRIDDSPLPLLLSAKRPVDCTNGVNELKDLCKQIWDRHLHKEALVLQNRDHCD